MSKFLTHFLLVSLLLGACTPKQMTLVRDTIELPDDKHGNPQVYEHYTSERTLSTLSFKKSGSTHDPSSKVARAGRAGTILEHTPIFFLTLQLTNPIKWCQKKMKTKINRSEAKRYKQLKKRSKGKFKSQNGNF